MAAIDYGLNHDLHFAQDCKLQASPGGERPDFDNDKDEVTRDFIDGTNSNLSNRSNRPPNLR